MFDAIQKYVPDRRICCFHSNETIKTFGNMAKECIKWLFENKVEETMKL